MSQVTSYVKIVERWICAAVIKAVKTCYLIKKEEILKDLQPLFFLQMQPMMFFETISS